MRVKWRNDSKNQQVVPLRTYTPGSLGDLVDIVKEAGRLGHCVRASGSRHSWSDVALTPDFMVLPTGLNRVLPLDEEVLKPPQLPAGNALVEVESGIRLRELNDDLWKMGLALPNMGGYDGQTIVGVTATSTHGSGPTFGPLTEIIRSMDVVDGMGNVLRVEKADGPSDPEKFLVKYGDTRTLIQDDSTFYALGVGLGSIALVYSVIIEVVPAFWLKEVRTPTTWEAERAKLLAGGIPDFVHYELLLNPYAIGGNHTCLVTTREPVPKPSGLPIERTNRNFFQELLASLGAITGAALRLIFNSLPLDTPKNIDKAINGLIDTEGYTNKSYKVFNIGKANDLPALSAEYAVATDDGTFIDAIDALLNVAAAAAADGEIYQSGPISVRFVKQTEFLLSPQYRRNTAMIEVIAAGGTTGAPEMLYRYEEEVRNFAGRPHWGQINHFAEDEVADMYPALADWKQVRSRLDPEGRFDGPLTVRAGL